MKRVLLLGALIVGGVPAAAQETGKSATEKVLGIGGVFFRSPDPAALARWYEKNLGIALTPTSYEQQPWMQEAGPTVFAPFPETSTHFGRDRVWMVNFRVRNLDAMAEQLRANGIKVDVDPMVYPNGRFGRLHDPDGNPIELWQPKAPTDPK